MTPTNAESLARFMPEAILTLGSIAAFLASLGRRDSTGKSAPATWVALLALAGAGAAALAGWQADPIMLFSGMIRLDACAGIFKVMFAIAGILGVLIALRSREIPSAGWGEFLGLVLAIVLGMFLLSMASNLLMIYLSLELVSLCSFVLAGLGTLHERRMAEGALKYVIYGGTASGLMLFGMSWLYGLTGTLDLAGIRSALDALPGEGVTRWTLLVALMLTLAGFGYKIAAAPFHQWAPDTYEGAPAPFVGFLSVGPKAAGFAVLLRFVITGLVDPATLQPVGEALGRIPIIQIVAILSVATMTLGNLTALVQTNVKRMLAYSSIAHAGYMLMGLTAVSRDGIASVVFYLWIYMFMNVGAFLVVTAVSHAEGSEDISAFRGLGRRAPLLAIIMTVFLFSLTGLPPLAGFIAKFYLFAAVIRMGTRFYYALAIVGVLNSVVSLYYYAAVVKAMFVEKGETESPLASPAFMSGLAVALCVPVILLGVYWAPLRTYVDWVLVGLL